MVSLREEKVFFESCFRFSSSLSAEKCFMANAVKANPETGRASHFSLLPFRCGAEIFGRGNSSQLLLCHLQKRRKMW